MSSRITMGRSAKALTAFALAAGVSASLVSCSAASAPEADTAHVAALAYALSDYTAAGLDAMTAELQKSGGDLQKFSADFDPQKQLSQCQDAITSGRFNVIVLLPVDGSAMGPCVTQAKEANIPVIAFESPIGPDRNKVEPQLDGVVGSVVYTPQRAGQLSSELIAQACVDLNPCNIIASIAAQADPFSSDRLKEIENGAAATDNEKIIAVIEDNYDPAETSAKLPDALRAHPDVNVIVFGTDTNAIVGLSVLKDAGMAGITVIGDGGSRAGKAAIVAGELFGTVATWPGTAGTNAAKIAIQAAAGSAIADPAQNFYDMGEPALVTIDNVSTFTSQWGTE